MTITFIGHGYVGLVTAAVFADLGNTVYVIGHTQEKIDNLKKGDRVVTSGGIIGTITSIQNDYVVLKVGDNENIKIEILKNAVTGLKQQ